MSIPYASATAGTKARSEIVELLRRFGCQSVGFMDEFDTKTVILAFVWRGRNVQLRATAQGWANLYLREKPWGYRMKRSKSEYEADALQQGMIAVNSILRDWVKGQVTAIETGILTFEHVFMPYMLTSDGKTLAEKVDEMKLLAPPSETGGHHERDDVEAVPLVRRVAS